MRFLIFFLFSAGVLAGGSLYPYQTKEEWDGLYELATEWGLGGGLNNVRLHYHHDEMMRQFYRPQANKYIEKLSWDAEMPIVLVGCGFNWIGEALAEQGIEKTICVEDSDYIQSAKLTNEDADIRQAILQSGGNPTTGDGFTLFVAMRRNGDHRSYRPQDILDEDLSTLGSRQRVRARIGEPGFDVLTHDGYLNTFTDAEAVALSANLHALSGIGRVIHHVYFSWINPKTVAEWKLLLPLDCFIDENYVFTC